MLRFRRFFDLIRRNCIDTISSDRFISGCKFFSSHGHSQPNKYPRNHWKYLAGLAAIAGGSYLYDMHPKSGKQFHALNVRAAENEYNKIDSVNTRKVMNFMADIVEKVAPSVVSIKYEGVTQTIFGPAESKGHGSGFIVQENGLILTNAHVVQGNSRLIVTLHDGRQYEGVVEHYDSSTDLATIRINAKNLPVLKLADSKNARPGEFVIAVGSPLSFANSVTHGVISNVQRRIDMNDYESQFFNQRGRNGQKDIHYIQTDAPITFGNSGGPLINMDGEAVGINNMAVHGVAGISFAIPADYAKDFLSQIENGKKASAYKPLFKRKRLGVTMLALNRDIIRELRFFNPNFPNIDHGILVHTVEPKSPAYNAGVRPGDIITHVDREPIFTPDQLSEKIQQLQSLTLTVLRNSHIENLVIEFS